MSKDRLAAFMDAVLAIIMTILVLELPKPDPLTWEGVWALKETYATYILSFFWLGTMWVSLHNEWHHIQMVTKKVVWLGIVLLFVTSWIPYSMSVVAIDPMNRVGQVLYGMSVLLVTFANLWLSVALYKCHVDFDECDSEKHAWLLRVKYIPDIIIKLIGMALAATVYPPAMMYSVLLARLWILFPVDKFYQPKER